MSTLTQIGEATDEERTGIDVPLGQTGTLAETKKADDEGREYVVLVLTPDEEPEQTDEDQPEVWTTLGTVQATSAEQAVRKIAENAAASLAASESTTFVAVPGRSFQPVTVKIETTTRVVFS